jgi:hypothetical protein
MISFEYGKKYPLKKLNSKTKKVNTVSILTCTGILRKRGLVRLEAKEKVVVCYLDETDTSEMAVLPINVYGKYYFNILASDQT